MDAVHEEEYKGYTIKILPDDDGDSPRDWDNLGVMVTWHRRYSLGDEQPRQSSEEWIRELAGEYTKRDSDDLTEEEAWKIAQRHALFLPLYLYDHGGITMNTTGFSCPWDSGQVGWIYVTKDAIRKEYSVKRISKKTLDRARRVLVGEVETYDQFLTGDVYGYVVQDTEGNVTDSCWGFYGEDYCLQDARGVVDYQSDKAGANGSK